MYEQRDVSDRTDLRVGADRTAKRIGACIHSTEGYNSLAWLQGGSAAAGSPASCDALITRNGSRFWLTAAGRFAYHAGQSTLIIPDRPGLPGRQVSGDLVSQYLIGIELERGGSQVINDQQVDSLAELLARCAITYGWRWPLLIVGHYSIARPLGRRSDPVNMDWGSLAGRLVDWSDLVGVPGVKLQR